MGDPLNANVARRLKAEVQERFGKKIRYMVYSHSHGDHSSGAEALDDDTILVSHRKTLEIFKQKGRTEALPELIYDDRMELELGGKKVILIHPVENHSDDATVMYFPEEKVLYGVDFFYNNRLA